MPRLTPALALALLTATSAPADEVPRGLAVTYLCAKGAVIQAAYLNPSPDSSFAVVAWDGQLLPMEAGMTGSGVRYVAIGDPDLVWHTKGREGTLLRGNDVLASDCREAGR